MKLVKFYTVLIFIILSAPAFSQAIFSSKASGNWTDTSRWQLISGTTEKYYPVINDSAIIANGDSILVDSVLEVGSVTITSNSLLKIMSQADRLSVSKELTITRSSTVAVDSGFLYITGNATINAASKLVQKQGNVVVLGVASVSAPTGSTVPTTGTSLIDVQGGIFACAGGLTLISAITSTRVAELRIGAGVVNIFGALFTSTQFSRINFTGNGTLVLGGVITIPLASSFIAGNGAVVYFGIPGQAQTIAPLTYNRLAIAGTGDGLKEITGTVTVTDTLALLIDTLRINAGGVLRLNNNSTIVRSAGKIISAPTFLGTANIIYNNTRKDTTGSEIPVSPTVLQSLTINNNGGIKLGSNITLNSKLILQQGALITDTFRLSINNPLGGAISDPAIERVIGFVEGKIYRSIGASVGLRIFPFGVSTNSLYRELSVNYATSPTTAGTLAAEHFNYPAPNESGYPLNDNGVILQNSAPFYWQANATNNLSGGQYNLMLTAGGITGVSNISNLRIVKRSAAGSPWTLDGTAGNNTGSNLMPVVIRNNMSGFSEFTVASNASNPLPINLLSFSHKVAANKALLSWSSTGDTRTSSFIVEKSKNANDYIEVGKINANGSNIVNNYSYTDELSRGVSFYRLKLINSDNTFAYSKTITVNSAENNNISLYPTAVTSYLNIIAPANEVFKVYNTTGAYVTSFKTGKNDVSNLAKGIYYVKSNSIVLQFVKQ